MTTLDHLPLSSLLLVNPDKTTQYERIFSSPPRVSEERDVEVDDSDEESFLLAPDILEVMERVHGVAHRVFDELAEAIHESEDADIQTFIEGLQLGDAPQILEDSTRELVQRVNRQVETLMGERGYGQVLQQIPLKQRKTWISRVTLPMVRELELELIERQPDYLELIHQADQAVEVAEEVRREYEQQVDQLMRLKLKKFVKVFNQSPDKRPLFKDVWFRRYAMVMDEAYGTDHLGKYLIPEKIPVTRDALVLLMGCRDGELVNLALDRLIEIIEDDPHEKCSAEGIVGLEKGLVELLTPDNAEELGTAVLRKLIRTYALAIQSMLLHYGFGQLGGVTRETKREIWDRSNDLDSLNKTQDPDIDHWVWYANQGAKRLEENVGMFEGIMERAMPLARIAIRVGMAVAMPETAGKVFDGAVADLIQVFEYIPITSNCYDELVVLQKLARVARTDMMRFKKIKRIAQNHKGDHGSVNERLLYGLVECLEASILRAREQEIREEALQIILQYVTIANDKVATHAVDVLGALVQQSDDVRLKLTAKFLLDLLDAGKVLNSEQARTRLEEVRREADRTLAKIAVGDTPVLENTIRFLLARIAEVKVEGYTSLAGMLATSEEATMPALLECIYQQPTMDLTKPDVRGRTLYHVAAQQGNCVMLDTLARLLDCKVTCRDGADRPLCDLPDGKGRTPLHLAAMEGHANAVHSLLDMGANCSLLDAQGKTPLAVAIERDDPAIVDEMIRHHARVSEDPDLTPILYAARCGSLEVLQHLLQQNFYFGHMNILGTTDPSIFVDVVGEEDKLEPLQTQAVPDRHGDYDAGLRRDVFFVGGLKGERHLSQFLRLNDALGFMDVQVVRYRDKPERNSGELTEPMERWLNQVTPGPDDSVVVVACVKNPMVFSYMLQQHCLLSPMESLTIQQMVMQERLTIPETLRNRWLNFEAFDEKFHQAISTGFYNLIRSPENSNPNERFCLGVTFLIDFVALQEYEVVESLLRDRGADPNLGEIAGFAPLHFAVYMGDERFVDVLLKHHADVNLRSGTGLTPLQMAAGHRLEDKTPYFVLSDLASPDRRLPPVNADRTKIIEKLLEAGADPRIPDANGMTIMHHAARNGQFEVCELLCERFPKLMDQRDEHGHLPLFYAFDGGDAKVTELLLDYDIKRYGVIREKWLTLANLAAEHNLPNALTRLIEHCSDEFIGRDEFRPEGSPLLIGCREGFEDIVRVCLKFGADVQRPDRYGRTPLHLAATSGHTGVVQQLIDVGADICARDRTGAKALHIAAGRGHVETMKLLINTPKDVLCADARGDTPLHRAAGCGQVVAVDYLVDKLGIDPNLTNFDGQRPLEMACFRGHLLVARYLLDSGADANSVDHFGRSPLHYAALAGNPGICEALIQHKADLKARDDQGETVLHKAAFIGNAAILRLVLQAEAKLAEQALIGMRDNYGETVMHEVAKRGSDKEANCVHILAAFGADMHAREENGETPLHVAAEHGNVDMIRALAVEFSRSYRELSSALAAEDHQENTPLHRAVMNGHHEAAMRLLDLGTDIDGKNNEGKTALMLAVQGGHHRLACHLILRGARVTRHDKDGRNALMLAVLSGADEKMLKLLLSEALRDHHSLITDSDKRGNTVLHHAARMGDREAAWKILKSLVFLSPSKRIKYLSAKNKDKMTAKLVAEDAGHDALARELNNVKKEDLGIRD